MYVVAIFAACELIVIAAFCAAVVAAGSAG